MSFDSALQDRMVKAIPGLRAFARSLCRNRDRADDLLQETLVRAIAGIHTFDQGSNLEAWLCTIMRNSFNNEYSRSKRTVQDEDDRLAETLSVPPEQIGWGIARDLRAGLGRLSPDQQQALYLVGAAGLSYEEAAEKMGCQPGTIKSRVSRARTMLAAFMGEDGVDIEKNACRSISREESGVAGTAIDGLF
jgi:RNA polymerase sigma-70 factor, ECF subfamily